MMTGEAVAFLDSDDSYHPGFIKAIAEAMERVNADMAVCRYTVHDADKSAGHIRKEMIWPKAEAGIYGRTEALQALVEGKINVSVWNKLYRSRLWDNIRFPDGHNYEDIDTTFRIFDICSSVIVLDQPLYHYLNRPGSITHTVTEENMRDFSLAKRHFEEFVSVNTPEVFSFEQLGRIRQGTLSGMIVNYVRYSGKRCELNSACLDRLRARIIEMGDELGFGSMDIRRKAAYLMILRSPALLKIAYLAYHAVKILIREITGR